MEMIMDVRLVVPLPLSIQDLPPPLRDPYTISLSDTEEPSTSSSSSRIQTATHPSTDETPSTPLPQKRRRTSTIHRLDALSETLTTPRLPALGSNQGQVHIKAEPLDEPGPSAALNQGQTLREIEVRDNIKPGYMADVPWLPGLPSRHRWRKTYEVSFFRGSFFGRSWVGFGFD